MSILRILLALILAFTTAASAQHDSLDYLKHRKIAEKSQHQRKLTLTLIDIFYNILNFISK